VRRSVATQIRVTAVMPRSAMARALSGDQAGATPIERSTVNGMVSTTRAASIRWRPVRSTTMSVAPASPRSMRSSLVP
jgi:hypothetical protein